MVDVPDPCRSIAVDKGAREGLTRPGHRIELARNHQHRQVLGDFRQARIEGGAVGRPEHRLHRSLGQLKTAQRVGDIGVDLGRIASEPVERRAGRLEGGVEGFQPPAAAGRGYQLEELVARGRAGKHKRRELLAVIQKVKLGREGAHAVADEDERRAGMFRSRDA